MSKEKALLVVIDRPIWGDSALLNNNGSMCCLGFVGKTCGLDDKEMLCRGYLSDRTEIKSVSPQGLFKRRASSHRTAEKDLAKINDCSRITRPEKEKRIIAIGREAGIKFKFVN